MSAPADPGPDPPPKSSLREQALAAARWVAIGRIVAEASAFASLIVLSRLLTPAEVGAAALPLAVGALAGGFLGGSFGSALVRSKDLDDRQVEVAVLLSLLSGVLLTAAFAAGSLLLDGVFGARTADLIMLASLSWMLSALYVVPQALRSRRLAFRTLSLIEAAATILGVATAVVLAAFGVGPASLVLGSLAGLAVTAVLALPGSGMRFPRWHASEAREILRFGIPASLSALFFTAARNVDYAILTARLSGAQVGLYFRAYTLAIDYQGKVTKIVGRILFPLLARAENEQFENVRARIIRLNTILIVPALALLAATAPESIPLLLGDDWRSAVTPTQILCIAGAAVPIGAGLGPMMMAAGHPRALLIHNVVVFGVFAATVYACSSYGLVTVCIGVAVYYWVGLVVSQYVLATRILGIPLRNTIVRDPGPALASAVPLVGVALALVHLLDGAGLPAFVTVLVASAAGAAAYLATLRTAFPGAWSDLRTLVLAMLPKRFRRG